MAGRHSPTMARITRLPPTRVTLLFQCALVVLCAAAAPTISKAQNMIPKGMLSFFNAQSCPEGWTEFAPAKGRLIVSVATQEDGGVTVNQPLADQEDRVHTHAYSAEAILAEKDIAAIDCCDDQGAAHGSYPVVNVSSSDTSGLPFVQLLLCLQDKDNVSGEVPYGTIAYFDPEVAGCPDNWQPFSEAAGRILVPAYKATAGAVPSSSAPLKSGEDRPHDHQWSVSFTPTDVSYAGVEGCCNTGPASSEKVSFGGAVASNSTGLPYIQLLTCQSTHPSFNSTLPSSALLWNSVQCAPGYNVSFDFAGRMLVTLPYNGLPGASFGGHSLPPGAVGTPSHEHQVSGSVTTKSAGVGLAAGCCGSGYAGVGTYEYAGDTAQHESQLPYIMAPLCQRQGLPRSREATVAPSPSSSSSSSCACAGMANSFCATAWQCTIYTQGQTFSSCDAAATFSAGDGTACWNLTLHDKGVWTPSGIFNASTCNSVKTYGAAMSGMCKPSADGQHKYLPHAPLTVTDQQYAATLTWGFMSDVPGTGSLGENDAVLSFIVPLSLPDSNGKPTLLECSVNSFSQC